MYHKLSKEEVSDGGSDGLVLHVHDTSTGSAPDYKQLTFNGPVPTDFESDNFYGKLLILHRPTSSYDNKANGEAYPFKQHFHGRKRLWEWRLQGRFKRKPGVLYAGIELEEYVHHNLAARTLTRAILPLVQRTLECKDVLHELGSEEDPELRPVVVAPVWAADNTLIASASEEVPDITVQTLPTGLSRKAARQYWDALWAGRSSDWEPSTTYTFCIWGPSPLLDLRNLVFRKLPLMWGRELPFATFCGHQPIHAVIYELSADAPNKEHRQGNKVYVADIRITPEALWVERMSGEVARPAALSAEHLQALDEATADNSTIGGAAGANTAGGPCRSESFCSAVSHDSDPGSDLEEGGSSKVKPPMEQVSTDASEEMPLPRVTNIMPHVNGGASAGGADRGGAGDVAGERLEPTQLGSPVSAAAARERLLPRAGEAHVRERDGEESWLVCCRRRRRRPPPTHQWLEVV